MMARKFGLGRGLDALLDNNDEYDIKFAPAAPGNSETDNASPTTSPAATQPPSSQPSSASSTTTTTTGTVELPISQLVPNQGQPRKKFDETELNELAASIKTYGIIQPVIAANAGDGTYIIIAGERRTRAAKLAGLETVPAIIRDYTDQKKLEISLIENIQRTDLNPIEEAAAYKNLMDFSNLSQDDLAARLGKNRSTVANALRLLKLPIEIQKSIEEGKVSSGHARALLSVTDAKARDKLYMELLSGEISVRETEKKAAALNSETTKGEKTAKKGKERPPEVDAMEEKFITKLGTKVVIDGDHNKGRILIDYYSMEDLERLHDLLGG
jgi:ParB family transcriptional regulator, chromosome partitioning protein